MQLQITDFASPNIIKIGNNMHFRIEKTNIKAVLKRHFIFLITSLTILFNLEKNFLYLYIYTKK